MTGRNVREKAMTDIQIAISAIGDASVLQASPQTAQAPGAGEIRVRHHAIGINFVDIYHRSGIYPLPAFPAVPGVEGAGIVEAVGADVTGLKPGDRIAYAGTPIGAYASTRLLPAWRAIALPPEIPFDVAAASMLRGLTAQMLFNRVHRLVAGETVLVHAAAGGLGQYLTRWAKHIGATVIGTAGSEDKAAIARQAGADHVIVGRGADYVADVLARTEGRGADFIVDGIGSETFQRNFQAIRSFGTVASVGQAGGPIPPIAAAALSPRSASFSRPSVIAHISDQQAYRTSVADVLAMIRQGISASIGATYPLAEAARAHVDMESGKTTGSLLLMP
jgi:NADPH:quinone reductase